MKQFKHGRLELQRKAVNRTGTVFLGTYPDVNSGADTATATAPAIRHPYVHPATTTSKADLIVPQSSSLCPRIAHCLCPAPVQYHPSLVSKIPKQ